ncbi:MAG: Bug family tripartite tricarboxylate transporter substrate binding protein [Lautropia sp.]
MSDERIRRSRHEVRRRQAIGSAAAFAAAWALARPVGAQQGTAGGFPDRPIRLVVPYAAGSQVDVTARTLGKEMAEILGQPFVIDNKPGASTLIGAEFVAKSRPDGYTLLMTTNSTSAANKSLFKSLPYDPLQDFAHVGRASDTSLILVTRADLPVDGPKAFFAHAKGRKPPLTAAYWSAGSQVALMSLKLAAGFDVVPVSYKSSPQAVSDVLGGQVDFTFTDFTTAMPHVRGGRLKAIGVSSPRRSLLAPDIAALGEELPGYGVVTWTGVLAPAGTPEAIVARLNSALNAALARDEVKARFAEGGFQPSPTTPGEFTKFVETEITAWGRMLEAAGIAPQ